MSRALPALLVLLASLAFPLGLVLPLMTLERLIVFTETPSLIDVVAGLWAAGDGLLAGVVALVSIAFPAGKLVWLQLVTAGVSSRGLARLHALGRWSMMDVLVVALVVFAAKTSGLASAVAEPGLWAYGLATLSAAAAAQLLERGGAAAIQSSDSA